MNPLLLRTIRQWFPLAMGISIVMFSVYVGIQQTIRIGANDPQIQMAEDLLTTVDKGLLPQYSDQIDISKSLSPFFIIYDKSGEIVTTNAVLEGKKPILPKSALEGHKGTALTNENRITWQPQPGTRIAAVISRSNNSYVLVGRNMREVEIHEHNVFIIVLIGWFTALWTSLVSILLIQISSKKWLKLLKD